MERVGQEAEGGGRTLAVDHRFPLHPSPPARACIQQSQFRGTKTVSKLSSDLYFFCAFWLMKSETNIKPQEQVSMLSDSDGPPDGHVEPHIRDLALFMSDNTAFCLSSENLICPEKRIRACPGSSALAPWWYEGNSWSPAAGHPKPIKGVYHLMTREQPQDQEAIVREAHRLSFKGKKDVKSLTLRI